MRLRRSPHLLCWKGDASARAFRRVESLHILQPLHCLGLYHRSIRADLWNADIIPKIDEDFRFLLRCRFRLLWLSFVQMNVMKLGVRSSLWVRTGTQANRSSNPTHLSIAAGAVLVRDFEEVLKASPLLDRRGGCGEAADGVVVQDPNSDSSIGFKFD